MKHTQTYTHTHTRTHTYTHIHQTISKFITLERSSQATNVEIVLSEHVTVLTNGEPTAEIVDVSVNEHPKVILPV